MFRLSYLLIPISLAVILILSACGGDEEFEHRELGPQEGINGANLQTDQTSRVPTQGALPTVEVVRILTPSVVQIVTETLAMGSVNQPVRGRGVDYFGNVIKYFEFSIFTKFPKTKCSIFY